MNISKILSKAQFWFHKNKGLIFAIAGGVCEVAAVCAMAKQALKAEKELVPANKKIAKLKEELNNSEELGIVPEEHKKEIRKIQRQTFVKLSKIYAVPVIFTGASLAFIGGSYKVMKDTQIALGAAYVTLDKAFKSYRDRVKEKLGDKEENAVYKDIYDEKVSVEKMNAKTGEITEVEKAIKRAHSGGAWEVLFDATSRLYTRNGRMNYETLMERQKQANITLKVNGFIFLYDIFKLLELDTTCIDKDLLIASKVIGWIYDEKDPYRSNWVSFGISDELGNYNEIGKELFDNVEKDVMLSFNPDGNILLDNRGSSFAFFTKN